MCTYIYISTNMYLHIYIHKISTRLQAHLQSMCTYIYISTNMYLHIYIHNIVSIFGACVCVCVCVSVCVCVCVYLHIICRCRALAHHRSASHFSVHKHSTEKYIYLHIIYWCSVLVYCRRVSRFLFVAISLYITSPSRLMQKTAGWRYSCIHKIMRNLSIRQAPLDICKRLQGNDQHIYSRLYICFI